jgi:hypothetical protein
VGIGEDGVRELPGLGRPHGEHGERRDAAEPRGQVGEKAERRRVRPLRVVDRQQQRAAGGEVRRQPVQPVQGAEQRVRAGRQRQAGDRCRECRGPGEQLGPLALVRARQDGLE